MTRLVLKVSAFMEYRSTAQVRDRARGARRAEAVGPSVEQRGNFMTWTSEFLLVRYVQCVYLYYLYIHIHMYIRVFAYMYICIYVNIYIYIYTHMCTYIYKRAYICTEVCVDIQCIYIYTYVHIHAEHLESLLSVLRPP